MRDVFLLPGEYFVGSGQYQVRTLLGSCVSIILWHPRGKTGAMSHYLLARRNNKRNAGLNARYGEDALVLMLGELAKLGIAGKDCEAKIFGGGEMFPEIEPDRSVGRKNGDAAHELLQAHGIPVVSENLFGDGHRQIVFNVDTGFVWSRQVNPGDIALPAVTLKKAKA